MGRASVLSRVAVVNSYGEAAIIYFSARNRGALKSNYPQVLHNTIEYNVTQHDGPRGESVKFLEGIYI